MRSNHPNSQETDSSTFYVSAIEIRLAVESRKTIESIRVCKGHEKLRDVQTTISAGHEHREEFNPPLSLSPQDYISASVSYSTQWMRQATMSVDISLHDNECVREEQGAKCSFVVPTDDVQLMGASSSSVSEKETKRRSRGHQPSPVPTASRNYNSDYSSLFEIPTFDHRKCVGKSSLIHKVFGVPDVKPSHNIRGEANIEREFTSSTNDRFVVHDSLGFEAGDKRHMQFMQEFIAKRKKMPELKDQLHAIWLCLEIPYAGGRLLETGVENFLQRKKEILGDVPLVVVLTKVDLLDGQLELEPPENETPENFKSKYMNEHCIKPLHKAAGNDVTHITISTLDGYSESLSDLLKATDKNMIKYSVGEAPRVLATIAQRISIKEKIELSISIGKKKYWNMLLTSAAFRGHTLDDCLKVIRKDITDVWNFNDPDECLLDDGITRNLLHTDNLEGATDVAASSDGASSVPGLYRRLVESQDPVLSVLPTVLWIACPPLKAYEAYQEAKKDVKILMAYIVDLISLMQIVFPLVPRDRVTQQMTAFAVRAYEGSRKGVHRLVEEFDGKLGVLPGGRDYVLEKIEEWIWRFSIADDQIQELMQRVRD